MDAVSISALVVSLAVALERVIYYFINHISKSQCSNCCSFDTKDDTDDENKQFDKAPAKS
jgi:hypothetical protein